MFCILWTIQLQNVWFCYVYWHPASTLVKNHWFSLFNRNIDTPEVPKKTLKNDFSHHLKPYFSRTIGLVFFILFLPKTSNLWSEFNWETTDFILHENPDCPKNPKCAVMISIWNALFPISTSIIFLIKVSIENFFWRMLNLKTIDFLHCIGTLIVP